MVSKTISITEEVYQMIKNIKLPFESFGDVIKKLIDEKTARNLLEWVNNVTLWEDMKEQELETIQNIGDREKTSFTITKVVFD